MQKSAIYIRHEFNPRRQATTTSLPQQQQAWQKNNQSNLNNIHPSALATTTTTTTTTPRPSESPLLQLGLPLPGSLQLGVGCLQKRRAGAHTHKHTEHFHLNQSLHVGDEYRRSRILERMLEAPPATQFADSTICLSRQYQRARLRQDGNR